MTYAHITDGQVAEYPVYEGEIRLRFPNVSFPVPFQAPEGYELVSETAPPAVTYEQNLSEGIPAFVEGQWCRTWVVTEASAEEIAERLDAAWARVRRERNAKLNESDKVVIRATEAGTETPLEWREYRQSLRDITEQADPFNIVWPTEPGA